MADEKPVVRGWTQSTLDEAWAVLEDYVTNRSTVEALDRLRAALLEGAVEVDLRRDHAIERLWNGYAIVLPDQNSPRELPNGRYLLVPVDGGGR